MTATATQSSNTPLPAHTAEALTQFIAAWLALRPYAPDKVRSALSKGNGEMKHLWRPEARKARQGQSLTKYQVEEYGEFEAFPLDSLKEFGVNGDTCELTLDTSLETLISDFVAAYHAFILADVPRVVVDSFFEAFCEIGNEAFTEQERDTLAMRRMFDLI